MAACINCRLTNQRMRKLLEEAQKQVRDIETKLAFKNGELASLLEMKKELSKQQQIESLMATHKRLKNLPKITADDLPANWGKITS